jgi:hypothetical protein
MPRQITCYWLSPKMTHILSWINLVVNSKLRSLPSFVAHLDGSQPFLHFLWRVRQKLHTKDMRTKTRLVSLDVFRKPFPLMWAMTLG